MARAVLERARATLALPLCIHDRTIGMLLLGARRSGKSFGADDVGLLRTLAHQTAMALHNARSYEELAALTRDLDVRVRQRTDELRASNERLSDAYTELQRTQAKLVHSEKMSSLGQLVAGVAHELNNPASFVYGSLANLAEYVDTFVEAIRLYEQVATADPEMRAKLEDIRSTSRLDYLLREAPGLLRICTEGSERIKHIVDDLRAFARAGESQRVATDVREGIESTLGLLRHRLSAGGISVVRDYQDIPTIEAAPGELNQAWMNLLSNAVDALDSPRPPGDPHRGSSHAAHGAARDWRGIRVDRGGDPRQRGRDRSAAPDTRLRAVLHHETDRTGDRPRPQHHVWRGEEPRRRRHAVERRRWRHEREGAPAGQGARGGMSPQR